MFTSTIPGMQHISDAVTSTETEIDNYRSGKKSRIKIFSDKFNALTGGLLIGEQLTIGARPGVGKSTIANLLLLSMIDKNPNLKLLFLYWTMEMSMQEQILRLMSYHIRTRSSTQILSESKTDADVESVKKAGDLLRKYPVFMRDARTSVSQCTRTWDIIANDDNFSDYNVVNLFDHTRLIHGSEEREAEKITNLMSAGIEYKNKMTNTNIYLSQLNRNVESASVRDRDSVGRHLPQLTDLFGADSVGQFSTMVILLHSPARYRVSEWPVTIDGVETTLNTDKLLLGKIEKNRNGPQGVLAWYEDLAHGRVYDTREELPHQQNF